MRHVAVTAALVMMIVGLIIPAPVWASPADPVRGKACWVHDANGVQYTDLDCDWQEVVKYDENGNKILIHYRDHGHVPPGAALPDRTIRMIFVVNCNCYHDGIYWEELMPNGAYMSHGPMQFVKP